MGGGFVGRLELQCRMERLGDSPALVMPVALTVEQPATRDPVAPVHEGTPRARQIRVDAERVPERAGLGPAPYQASPRA